jgi:hypothetical protein
MAEIAANVLHNVGNELNSLNISASMVTRSLKTLRTDSLARVVSMLQGNTHHLATFLTEDDRGASIPEFLSQLSMHLQSTQQSALSEMQSLTQNIEHIKQIVAAQQAHAKRCD